MEEIWKDVKDFEGLYQISNLGRVRSCSRVVNNRQLTGLILKLHTNSQGYIRTNLSKYNRDFNKSVHRLVAEAFIPNPNNLPQINHIDEDKTNNSVSNLEWCTAEYNINYGTRTSKISKPINQYDLNNNFIKRWESINEAARQTGVWCSNICMCLKGKIKRTKGYKWSYE